MSAATRASRIVHRFFLVSCLAGLFLAAGCQSPWQNVVTSKQTAQQQAAIPRQQVAATPDPAVLQGEMPPFVELLDVDATVAPHATKSGWLTLTVTNRSHDGISFIDIPEGAGNNLWKPEIRTASGKLFKYSCSYAPAAEPELVTL